MADGTSFVIDIPVDGASAAAGAVSVDALAAALDRASAASSAAASAVAAAESSYAVAEAAANKAALAVERAGVAATAQEGKLARALEVGDAAAIERATEKLARLRAAQESAAAKSATASAALAAEAVELDRLREAATGAAAQEEQLAARLQAASDAAGSGKANEAAEALGKLGGPLGGLGQKVLGMRAGWDKLKASMGDTAPLVAGAVGVVAVAAAVAALVVGLGVGAAKLGAWAIANADAARTSALLSQGIAGSVEGGLALDKTISALGSKVPLTADELRGMAGQLAKSGLSGDALGAALEEAAVKAAKLKFGPDFAKQLLSLDYQSQKLRADVGKIFGGLKIEKLLGGLASVAKLFDENSSSARAIKVVFESLFQPLVDGAAAMLPKIVAAFLQFEIYALKALIALKPYTETFLTIGRVAVGALVPAVAIFGGLLAVGVALVVSFVTMADAAIRFGGAIANGAAYGAGYLLAKMQEVKAWLSGFSLSDVGKALIDGLAAGLVSAGPKVLTAITGVANAAITAAKKALGIASPSKVFAEIGANTAAGMSAGVDDGAADVESSMAAMVAPPAVTASAPSASAPAASGGGAINITINVDGAGKDAQGLADTIAAKVRDVLEGLAQQTGAQVAA